jgi:hypothetical protein
MGSVLGVLIAPRVTPPRDTAGKTRSAGHRDSEECSA